MRSKPLLCLLVIAAGLMTISSGCTKSDPVHVPKVNADSSRTVTLPATVTLNGSATNTDGGVTAWLWSEVSGPNVAVIDPAGSATTTISGLAAGTYVFQLEATDASGSTGSGQVTITVQPPVSQTLYTTFDWGRYETYWQGNSSADMTDISAYELCAITWTVNGVTFYGRSGIVFNMTGLPANVPVKSATLSLYSNPSPRNGDLTNANAGPTNAFYITRIANAWDHATTFWPQQPGIDTVGQVLIPQTNQSFLDVTDVDVTTMVNRMISIGNYGFELRLQNEQIYNSRIFLSGGASDQTKWPKLVINY